MNTFAQDFAEIKKRYAGVIKDPITFRMRKFQRIDKMSVESLDLSVRSLNGLKRNGVYKVDDVVNKWDLLGGMRGIGKTCVQEIRYAVIALYYTTLDTKEKVVFWYDAFGVRTDQEKGA